MLAGITNKPAAVKESGKRLDRAAIPQNKAHAPMRTSQAESVRRVASTSLGPNTTKVAEWKVLNSKQRS